MKKISLLLSAIATVFFSCKREMNPSAASLPPTEHLLEVNIDKIPHQNGVLIFESHDHMYAVAKALSDRQGHISTKIENDDFISMRAAYDSINKAEVLIADSLEDLEVNTPGSVSERIFNETHSDLFNTFPNSFFVNTFPDGTKYLEINTRYLSLADIANKDGFIQIGTELHQIDYDTLKMKENGTPADIQVLKSATTSDPAKGIYVETITNNATASKLINLPVYTAFGDDCQKTSKRVRINAYYDMVIYRASKPPAPLTVVPEHKVRAIALRRRLFGLWWDNAGDGADVQITWNVIGTYSQGVFVKGNVTTAGTVNWTTSGSRFSFSSPLEHYISYNPITQGLFYTPQIPVVFQARTRNQATVYTKRGHYLGYVECECRYFGT